MTKKTVGGRVSTEELYEQHLARLKDAPVVVVEPKNGGPRLAHFVRVVNGMGKRAQDRGTIARTVRQR